MYMYIYTYVYREIAASKVGLSWRQHRLCGRSVQKSCWFIYTYMWSGSSLQRACAKMIKLNAHVYDIAYTHNTPNFIHYLLHHS